MPGDDPTPALPGIPEGFEPVIPLDAGFDALYGLELVDLESDGDIVCGRVAIHDELRLPTGLLHGGVISALAEALASRGTWFGARRHGDVVMGMSNDTTYLEPFVDGYVNAVATPRHRGRTRWLWEVLARDDEGRLCAVTMVNVAVRSHPSTPDGCSTAEARAWPT